MQSANYNWEVDAGDGQPLSGSLTADGVAVNLTGCTAQLDVRPADKNTVLLFTLSTGNGKIVLGGALGTFVCTPASADTVLMSGTYQYDMKIVDVAGKIQRYLKGQFRVNVPVTP